MVDADACLLSDVDRRTPLHLAVMQVDVVRELVRARSEVITLCRLDHGEIILHLCVVYNRLEALTILFVEMNWVDDFVNIKDDNGDTILHRATALRQIETIRYLLSRSEVMVNAANGSGFTPLDVIESMPRDTKTVEIRELLIQSGGQRGRGILATSLVFPKDPFERTPTFVDRVEATDNSLKVKVEQLPSPQCSIVKKFLKKKQIWLKKKHKSIRNKMKKEHSWVEKKRDSLMVAATVIAAMAYQAALNPPGGVWPEDKQISRDDIKNNMATYEAGPSIVAGTSILATYHPLTYMKFWVQNMMSFAAALSIILLLVSGVPLKRREFMWLLMLAMWLTMTFLALTYSTSMQAITPIDGIFKDERNTIIETIDLSLRGWLVLIGIVFTVYTCQVIFWIIRKVHKFRERRFAESK